MLSTVYYTSFLQQFAVVLSVVHYAFFLQQSIRLQLACSAYCLFQFYFNFLYFFLILINLFEFLSKKKYIS